MTDALTQNLIHFARFLRASGMKVDPGAARSLAAAAIAVGMHDRSDLYHAFKSVTVIRPAEMPIFDEAFELFFGSDAKMLMEPESSTETGDTGKGAVATLPVLRSAPSGPEADEPDELSDVVGGSYRERLAARDFSELDPREAEEVRRMISIMLWRAAEAESRRWRPSASGSKPDLRRTFRGLVGPTGDLMPMAFSERRRRKRPLVVLADISGSMERYTEMFLHFIHAAQGRLGRVEAFVFATRLTRISREMRRRDTRAALRRVAGIVEDWSGGTRIGEALEDFNRGWSRRVTRGGAIGLVISDGWDTGDPDLLEREMSRFARSMHRTVWLNPLAGRSGYAPETRGMRTVLPFVDDFLPAGTLLDLKGVVRLLESIPAHRRSMVKV